MSRSAFLVLAALMASGDPANGGAEGQRDVVYRVVKTAAAPAALLTESDSAWASAPEIAWGPAAYRTRFRALWSPMGGLFVRFDAADPAPWATLTERDDRLWTEEVVEIFIDPDGDGANYAEIEISPHNVLCDLLVYEGAPDLRADIDWDFHDLRSQVFVQRNDADETVGWVAVAHLPWKGFENLPATDGVSLPPAADDSWRFNVFRIKRPGGPAAPQRDAVFAAWAPVSGTSFHEPAVFRGMVFVE